MNRIIGVFLMLASFAIGWCWMAYKSAIDTPLHNDEPVIFEIQKGDSLQQMIRRLDHVLSHPLWFKLHVYLEGVPNQLKAGEYEIPPGTTPRQLLDKVVAGRVRQHAITLVEGWTFNQIMWAISGHPALKKTLSAMGHEEIMDSIGASGEHPEGRFFPDTYFFPKGTSDVQLLKRAYRRMQKTLDREWGNRAEGLPLSTPYEALILASIIERETAQPDERALIAGVFIRRLQKGMRLQADPTVIYGMGEQYNGNIGYQDLRQDSPYNTYVYSGLPPTPIAMPSHESIHAALHPDQGNSLYFVSRGDGSHVFSTTLEDHSRAVELFQKKAP